MQHSSKITEPTPATGDQPRVWQRMLSGRRLDLVDPHPEDIEIEDIAHGLSRVARWNGQTIGPHAFSVAQHCMLVLEIALFHAPQLSKKDQQAILLHDAPEYVIGDMISPFKAVLGEEYKSFESRLQRAIHKRFTLPETLSVDLIKIIKKSDRDAAWLEATTLAGFSQEDAYIIFGDKPEYIPEQLLIPMEPEKAKATFITRFQQVQTT